MGRYSNARRWVVSFGLFFCVTAATAGPEVQFTDITRSTNIDFKHENSDDDGFTDIFVANDSVASFLYHNNGNGTFTEVGFPAGVAYNEDGKTFAGMGADFSDYDNDGRPDIVVTDLSNERYHLFHNNGEGTFQIGRASCRERV